MKRFNTVYPYFETPLYNLQLDVERIIKLTRNENTRIALEALKTQILFIRKEMAKKPSLSNVNLENTVNDCFLQAKGLGLEIDGVLLQIHFVENPDVSRIMIANPIILL